MQFTRRIDPCDWERLQHYAPYIHELITVSGGDVLDTSALTASIPLPSPTLMPLLPNLRVLDLFLADLNALRLFASPSVVNLFTFLSDEDCERPNQFLLECIGARMPNLQKLNLRDIGGLSSEADEAFPGMCSTLTKLKSLSVPWSWIFEQFEQVAPHLVALEELSLYCSEIDKPFFVFPKVSLDKIPSVRSLSLFIPYEDFQYWVHDGNDMSHIISLEIIAAQGLCPTGLLLAVIPTGCPNLQVLRLPQPDTPMHSPPVDFQDLKPLRRLAHLRVPRPVGRGDAILTILRPFNHLRPSRGYHSLRK
ncbi:hypothetical protein ONZ45_g6146 [Pleurotus djamor]|nr:hypothetical protein ONZ45_g6146 [Pleurotus djamor]